jgi:molybdopterin-guanine dinucleotide biosynthesis protein MobB
MSDIFMTVQSDIPVIGFAAFSGTGKTTLLVKLIPLLKAAGLRLGLIKHAHHRVDVDQPGKDSFRLRKAGAAQVLLASSRRWALMVEEEFETEPTLTVLLERLDVTRLDLVLVEGFRYLHYPKIELHRPVLGKPLLFPDDPSIIALATDAQTPQAIQIPCLDLNDPMMIRDFILRWVGRT